MLTSFNWADWAILAVVIVSSLISLLRGFVREALSLVSWAVAFFIAVLLMVTRLAGDRPRMKSKLSIWRLYKLFFNLQKHF